MKTRQFLKSLKAKGATVDTSRGKGGHVLVTLNDRPATVPSHGDTDFDPGFLDDMCQQLGTRPRELTR
jgi:predicted RNA binding protein YcfA (HicA-like mRNA interferase family)